MVIYDKFVAFSVSAIHLPTKQPQICRTNLQLVDSTRNGEKKVENKKFKIRFYLIA